MSWPTFNIWQRTVIYQPQQTRKKKSITANSSHYGSTHKMVYYKPVQVLINVSRLRKFIIYIKIQLNSLFDPIISNHSLIFNIKFWFLEC